MRLRQLSRKLDVDTGKIIQHLKASNLPCDDDSNAKLSEEQLALLIHAFGPIDEPALEDIEPVVESLEEHVVVQEEPEVAALPEEEITDIAAVESQLSEPAPSQSNEEANLEPEIIRAPKIELTGLKVVGKIELRSPKKKDENETEVSTPETSELQRMPKDRAAKERHKKREQPRKNSLTPAEQRAREEKIKLRKKRDAEQQAKKKKRENYLKKVKAKEKTEAKKIKPTSVVNTAKPGSNKNEGLITRFFNWIRRE